MRYLLVIVADIYLFIYGKVGPADMIRQRKVLSGAHDRDGWWFYYVFLIGCLFCLFYTWHACGPSIVGRHLIHTMLSLLRHSYHLLVFPKIPFMKLENLVSFFN
jgi:hypothetical protein